MRGFSPQCAAVYSYLDMTGNASVRELFIACNINSPRKRISELIAAGADIDSFWDVSEDEFGNKTRYKRYYIRKGENQIV